MDECICLQDLTMEQLQIIFSRIDDMSPGMVDGFYKWVTGQINWSKMSAELWCSRPLWERNY
jgi:hypothetical protein